MGEGGISRLQFEKPVADIAARARHRVLSAMRARRREASPGGCPDRRPAARARRRLSTALKEAAEASIAGLARVSAARRARGFRDAIEMGLAAGRDAGRPLAEIVAMVCAPANRRTASDTENPGPSKRKSPRPKRRRHGAPHGSSGPAVPRRAGTGEPAIRLAAGCERRGRPLLVQLAQRLVGGDPDYRLPGDDRAKGAAKP